jgi:hypothetical protein
MLVFRGTIICLTLVFVSSAATAACSTIKYYNETNCIDTPRAPSVNRNNNNPTSYRGNTSGPASGAAKDIFPLISQALNLIDSLQAQSSSPSNPQIDTRAKIFRESLEAQYEIAREQGRREEAYLSKIPGGIACKRELEKSAIAQSYLSETSVAFRYMKKVEGNDRAKGCALAPEYLQATIQLALAIPHCTPENSMFSITKEAVEAALKQVSEFCNVKIPSQTVIALGTPSNTSPKNQNEQSNSPPLSRASALNDPSPGQIRDVVQCVDVKKLTSDKYRLTNTCSFDIILTVQTEGSGHKIERDTLNLGRAPGSFETLSYYGTEPAPIWACATASKGCSPANARAIAEKVVEEEGD